jgi:hypothetical protein
MARPLATSPSLPLQPVESRNSGKWLLITILFAITYVVSVLVITVPILRLAEMLPGKTWISQVLIKIGSLFHLPSDLHILQNPSGSQSATGFSEFLLLLILIFGIYILYAFYLKRQEEHLLQAHRHIILLVISATTLVAAFIYIFTPAILSGDIYLYADYGRILVFHHANPYFIPPIKFPHDPITHIIYWKNLRAIYGPIWLLVSALLASFSGTVPLNIFIVFRIFASIMHFINIFLVFSILRTQGRSIRIILLGTFLYALNPLILFESSLGGHNDILVTTFILLGIFYAVRAEKKGEVHIIHYAPALIALSLAALVKFTIIPIIVIFIVMLFCKVNLSPKIRVLPMSKRLLSALSTTLLASAICAAVAFIFYGPFWIGHSLKAITFIFSSQPQVSHSLYSLLEIVQFWNYSHPLPAAFAPLTRVPAWNIITYGGMILVMILGSIYLRHAPTIQNAIFVMLGTMAVFLLTTNWFTPWYLIWLLSLTIIYLFITDNLNKQAVRIKLALIAFIFTFSFSAFMVYNFLASYEYQTHPPHYGWLMLSFFVTFTLPVLAFLIVLLAPARKPGPPLIR